MPLDIDWDSLRQDWLSFLPWIPALQAEDTRPQFRSVK